MAALEVRSPGIKISGRYAQREMPGAPATVRWQMISLERRFRPKDQQHTSVANPEEHMPAFFPGGQIQPQDVAIEPFGQLQIVGVDGSLDKSLDGSHGRSPSSGLSGPAWPNASDCRPHAR